MTTSTESASRFQQEQAAQMEIEKKAAAKQQSTMMNTTPSATGSLMDRMKAAPGSAVYPSPSYSESGSSSQQPGETILKPQTTTTTTSATAGLAPSTTMRTTGGSNMMDPFTSQTVTAFSFIVVPALITVWRVFYANGGPTWFSLHPMMMFTSVLTLSGSILAQRIGGSGNLSRLGLLSLSACSAILLGFLAVWSVKEAYAKPHFKSIHSHFGGMTLGCILSYALAQMYVYNPFTGQIRPSAMKYKSQFLTVGKAIAGMGLMTMTVGVIEIERSYLMMLLWIASLSLFVPFLLL
jgi:hypothetical protein